MNGDETEENRKQAQALLDELNALNALPRGQREPGHEREVALHRALLDLGYIGRRDEAKMWYLVSLQTIAQENIQATTHKATSKTTLGERLSSIEQRLEAIERLLSGGTSQEREATQQRFLEAYNQLVGVDQACRYAGITRQTYEAWQAFDPAFRMQLADCRRGTWKKRDTQGEEGGQSI